MEKVKVKVTVFTISTGTWDVTVVWRVPHVFDLVRDVCKAHMTRDDVWSVEVHAEKQS